jgi:hypothetical protein
MVWIKTLRAHPQIVELSLDDLAFELFEFVLLAATIALGDRAFSGSELVGH